MSPQNLFGASDKKLIINTDGGSRGNPGPAAIGVVIGTLEFGSTIGRATNNVAEYKAVIFALEKAAKLLGKTKAQATEIELRLDSQLIERQMKGEYRIKEEDLKPLYTDVHNATLAFKKVTFHHVPREQNKAADRLVNQALDAE